MPCSDGSRPQRRATAASTEQAANPVDRTKPASNSHKHRASSQPMLAHTGPSTDASHSGKHGTNSQPPYQSGAHRAQHRCKPQRQATAASTEREGSPCRPTRAAEQHAASHKGKRWPQAEQAANPCRRTQSPAPMQATMASNRGKQLANPCGLTHGAPH